MNIEQTVDIDTVVREWNLNKEQSLAFHLIAEKSVTPTSEPLRLIISGQGGRTGKSRVIQAVTDYFKQSR